LAEGNHARRRAGDRDRKRTYLMPKKREKQETAESTQLLDMYES